MRKGGIDKGNEVFLEYKYKVNIKYEILVQYLGGWYIGRKLQVGIDGEEIWFLVQQHVQEELEGDGSSVWWGREGEGWRGQSKMEECWERVVMDKCEGGNGSEEEIK